MIRREEFTNKETISAIVAEQNNNFLWIAFQINSDGDIIILKTSATEPNQIYFEITREFDEVIGLKTDTNNLYAIYKDTNILAEVFNLFNPLTSYTQISRPETINEDPIDFTIDNSYIYILLPGNLSGEIAKILIYDISTKNLQETIELSQSGTDIINAKSISIDDSSNLWVATYTDPVQLVRVYNPGSGYILQITNIV